MMAPALLSPSHLNLLLLPLLLALSSPTPAVSLIPCSLEGDWVYEGGTQITFGPAYGPALSSYNITCAGNACGWPMAVADVDVDPSRPWSRTFVITFLYGTPETNVQAAGWHLGGEDGACASVERVLYFDGTALFSAPWCRSGNVNCTVPLDPLWTTADAAVHLIEIAHSDIGWLGTQDDILVDATGINASLKLMDEIPAFQWQHECILFLRAYVEMYGPDAEATLVARMAEGRFDIGGTFTEGFESTM
jgi:hypothetical protein